MDESRTHSIMPRPGRDALEANEIMIAARRIVELEAQVAELEAERDRWKAHHENVVHLKRQSDAFKREFQVKARTAEQKLADIRERCRDAVGLHGRPKDGPARTLNEICDFVLRVTDG